LNRTAAKVNGWRTHPTTWPTGHDAAGVDFHFELVFQILYEFLVDFLIENEFKGAAVVLRSRIGRYATSAITGFVFGVIWGAHVAEIGTPHRPRLFWVSVTLAVLALLGAGYRRRRAVDAIAVNALAWPWTWPASRWAGFAVLNGAVAAGVATGWHPPVVG
jgi:hypothetical protein